MTRLWDKAEALGTEGPLVLSLEGHELAQLFFIREPSSSLTEAERATRPVIDGELTEAWRRVIATAPRTIALIEDMALKLGAQKEQNPLVAQLATGLRDAVTAAREKVFEPPSIYLRTTLHVAAEHISYLSKRILDLSSDGLIVTPSPAGWVIDTPERWDASLPGDLADLLSLASRASCDLIHISYAGPTINAMPSFDWRKEIETYARLVARTFGIPGKAQTPIGYYPEKHAEGLVRKSAEGWALVVGGTVKEPTFSIVAIGHGVRNRGTDDVDALFLVIKLAQEGDDKAIEALRYHVRDLDTEAEPGKLDT